MPTARKASDFLASLGINTHLEYTDGAYNNSASARNSVLACLQYLGITKIRDGCPFSAGGQPVVDYRAALNLLMGNGIGGVFFVGNGQTISASLTELGNLELQHPGKIIAVEGPNETNNFPIGTYTSLTGEAADLAFQRDLYTAVKAHGTLGSKPVYYYTGLYTQSTLAARADYANGHPYPPGWYGQPSGRLDSEYTDHFTMTLGSYLRVGTETGYTSFPTANGGVDTATQAKNTLNLYLDAFNQGLAAIYPYQLLAAYSPTGFDEAFGFFNIDYTPKLVATAVHNLTTILADASGVFTPGTLSYTISGLPSTTGKSMLLQKSNGSYWLCLWNEVANWNNSTHLPISVAPVTVTVTLSAQVSTTRFYAPYTGSGAFQTNNNVTAISVTVTDHPTLVEIIPGPPVGSGTLYQVVRNGVTDTSTSNIDLLLYHSRAVYKRTNPESWAHWNGVAWVADTHDPRQTESAQDATLTSTTGSLIDANFAAWTLQTSASSGLQVYKDGLAAGTTSNVVLLLYHNSTIYQQNSAGNWWSWNGATWVSTVDPRGVVTGASPPLLPTGYLHTSGAAILDSTNRPIRICSTCMVCMGSIEDYGVLFTKSYQSAIQILLDNGINCIRISVGDARTRDNPVIFNGNASLNPDIATLPYNAALKQIVDVGGSMGMKFIICSHMNEARGDIGQQPNGLWYDSGGASNNTDGGGFTGTITDATAISLWQQRATLFKNTAVIGYDLRNEPLGANSGGLSTWGGYNGTVGSNRDIRDYYQRAGNAIHAIDPNPLIICEFPFEWGSGFPEGDGRCIPAWPVTLNTPNKVVYSAHIYPATVGGYTPDSGSAYLTRQMNGWGHIVRDNQAPVWIGEMGSGLRVAASQTWAADTVALLNGTTNLVLPSSVQGQGVHWEWFPWLLLNANWYPQGDQGGIFNAAGTGVDTLQKNYWGQMLFSGVSSGGSPSGTTVSSSGTLIEGPLTGVTTGTWQFLNIAFTNISGGQFHFGILLPHGYTTAKQYPVLVYEHTNLEGNQWYQGGSNNLVTVDRIAVFNATTFRARWPCIVLVPFCDQTDGSAGSSGQNFGGYNDVAGLNVNENAVVAMVNYVWTNYSCFRAKTYITGDSLGGHGATAAMLDHNAINGPSSRTFTAGVPFAGQIFRSAVQYSNGQFVDSSIPTRMSSVPMFIANGAGDTTSPPENFNHEMWRALAGNSTFPPPPGNRAGTSQFYYMEDPALGHDIWDTGGAYRLYPGCIPFYDWMYRKTNPNTALSTASITDSTGVVWRTNTGLQIVRNGAIDATTEGVVLLLYWNGVVYQKNNLGDWYSWNGSVWSVSADPR